MEEQHKNILQQNRINLVMDMDPSALYEPLLKKEVFTPDMIDAIKSSGTRRDQARQLVRDLETRGNRAFPLFLESLRESGQQGLMETLLNRAPPVQVQPAAPIAVRPVVLPLPIPSPVDVNKQSKYIVPIVPERRANKSSSPTPDEKYFKPRPEGRLRRDSLQCYKMDSSPCGCCLIINNADFEPQSNLSNRKGSNVDSEKLEGRFLALNFAVEVKTNLKQRQLKQELSALSKKDHSQYDCCVVIILSHGTEVNHSRFPGAVYGTDGSHITVQYITNLFNGKNCPSLQGKPKLFFIQACGGDERDMGVEMSPTETCPSVGGQDDQTDAIQTSSSSESLSLADEVDARTSLPTPSDILVSYSTFPGFVSWRDTQAGSWYIETLDRILELNAETDDLATMLMMVNNEVSQNSAKGMYKQMPGSFNFLRKHLYFQTSA
ncbi:LOW QUALITY PROTEIN: caspase-9 [Xiphophorus hellerii]|uniref:LOW QUALITY PROTEIN: caspase-9 n=1 Tax=Xiphophorus hellerii TaxID=8084 RepID=UPI0013B3D282|nr:LOW QUALITY PROTEIN: caspase-9-like [Xiphophorus hellerii]